MLVLNSYKEQPAGWSRGTGDTALPRFHNLRDRIGTQAPFTYQQKRPDKVAHHVMKESIAPHVVDEQIALPAPFRRKDGANIVEFFFILPAFRIDGSKAGEVMRSDHPGRCPLHRILIQRIGVMMKVPRYKRRTNVAAKDSIFVGLSFGRVARVKLERCFCRFNHTN